MLAIGRKAVNNTTLDRSVRDGILASHP